ncbi:hypothetical protein QN363_19950, partial [Undibacterium sp. CCC2.1]|uniref:hypothetical protein n=1 Tax=unclassified Undibacterium TaxID=2630295 RepID=UPI002B2355F3
PGLKRLSQKGFQSVSLLQLADMSFPRALASSFLRRQESSDTLVPSGWERRSRTLFFLCNEHLLLRLSSTDIKGACAPLDCRLRGNDELGGWVDAQST